MLIQLCLLFLFLALGELIVYFTGIPVPSSIIGMLLLFLALTFKIVKLRWVEKVCDFFVGNLGFFFIPAGIGVMKFFGLISQQWFPIVMAVVLSTIFIIISTGGVMQFFNNKASKIKTRKSAEA